MSKYTILFILATSLSILLTYFYTSEFTLTRPTNCNEYAVAYIDMAREDYKINPESEKWSEVIDAETEIHKLCASQFEE